MTPRLLLITLLLPAAVAAQTASYNYYGTGCATSPPPFTVNGTPRVGGAFDVVTRTGVLRGVVTNQDSVFLFTGATRQTFDLSTLNITRLTGCGFLLCSTDIVLLMPYEQTTPLPYTVRIPVPNHASMLGAQFFQQVVVASHFGFSFTWTISASQGGVGVIGR